MTDRLPDSGGSSQGRWPSRGRPPGRSHLAGVIDEQYLRREYEQRGRSSPELAAEMGCSAKSILRYLELFGIPVRPRGTRRTRFPALRSASFLRTAHVVEGRTPSEIALGLGCSRTAVVDALRAAGVKRPAVDGDGAAAGDFLLRAYVVEGRSTMDIAAELGCGATTVARQLRRHGVTLRPRGGWRRAVEGSVTDDESGKGGLVACR